MALTRRFGEWSIAPNIGNPVSAECLAAFQETYPSVTDGTLTIDDDLCICIGGQQATSGQDLSTDGTTLTFNGFGWADLGGFLGVSIGDVIATREALPGYRLGPDTSDNPNRDKPLASEAEAEDLRTGKADKTVPAAAGNLAKLTDTGNLADSGKSLDDISREIQKHAVVVAECTTD